MLLTVLGINHRTAPVEIRGQVAIPAGELDQALADLRNLASVNEAAILSTCNRTELYCSCVEESPAVLIQWLCSYHDLEPAQLAPHLYTHVQDDAVRHILRVAAGLDSMILGEPQILGQMKTAWQQAMHYGTISSLVNRLFQHAFSVAKQIRTDTAIGASPVSVAFAAVSLARQIFGDFASHSALLLGAGETMELAARHLHDRGIGKLIIANRTVSRAHELAAQFEGYGIGLDEIGAHLDEADIVIASTGSPGILIGRQQVEEAVARRRHKPLLMIDIAVPADIDPDVASLDDVYLYTVDDLRSVIDENLRSRQQAALQAEEIIDTQVHHFMGWLRSLEAVPTVRAYREYAEALGAEELARARARIVNGAPAEAVVEQLVHALVQKLAHEPCVNLRNAVAEGDTALLDAMRRLYRLKDSE